MSHRTPSHPIANAFVERWSPRAFADKALSLEQLNSLFEAARWAPSAYNAQPWRFVYALKHSPEWHSFVELLIPANQAWAKEALALVFVISKTIYQAPGKEPVAFPSHAFDTGSAWLSLALQAHKDGLVSHAMGGFDRERARVVLAVPEAYELQAAVAVGYQGDAAQLPQALQSREVPSPRLEVSELAFAGRFR